MDKVTAPPNSAARAFFVVTAFTLSVQLLIGGTARPLNVLICFLASLPLLFLLLRGDRRIKLSWPIRIALALFGLAWLQLIPLPPQVWSGLPERELAAQILTISNIPLGWRPIALDPGAAVAALVSLIAPLVLLVGLSRLRSDELMVVLRAIIALALITAMLGLVQRVTGGLNLYDIDHAGYATGLFANRNHHAAFLAGALVLLPAVTPKPAMASHLSLAGGAATILYMGVLATTSRAGIALGTAGLIASFVMMVRPGWRTLLAGGIAAVIGGVLLLQVPALAPVFERFALLGEDQRLVMAEGSAAAARAFLPWGSGWGSFVPVYMAFEDLDTMTGRYIVAAHNDYLQLVVEGGLLGLLIALAGPGLLGFLAYRNWRTGVSVIAWSLWLVAAILLVHSFVDFPLRTGALTAFLALAVAAQEILQTPLPAQRRDD